MGSIILDAYEYRDDPLIIPMLQGHSKDKLVDKSTTPTERQVLSEPEHRTQNIRQ